MSEENCPLCKCREKWNGILSHDSDCSNIDFESARWYAWRYKDKERKSNESVAHWLSVAQQWEGKCSILRHENNVLRRKLKAKERS